MLRRARSGPGEVPCVRPDLLEAEAVLLAFGDLHVNRDLVGGEAALAEGVDTPLERARGFSGRTSMTRATTTWPVTGFGSPHTVASRMLFISRSTLSTSLG